MRTRRMVVQLPDERAGTAGQDEADLVRVIGIAYVPIDCT